MYLLIGCTVYHALYIDHDYGQNDGTFENEHRDLAKRLFLDAMAVDADDVRRVSTNGVYLHYPFQAKLSEDVTKTVDVVLMDVRYFSKQDGSLDILGEEQWEWLEYTLRNRAKGELTLLVSGIQIMPISRNKTSESWSRFDESQRRLLGLVNAIKLEKRREIVLISADVHRGEIMKMVCKSSGPSGSGTYYNELTEVTSSGLTHSIGEDAPLSIRHFVKLLHRLESDGISECLWREMNVGEIEVVWREDLGGIERVKISILDQEMQTQCASTLHPMVNENKGWHQVLSDREYVPLLETEGMLCYGAKQQYTENQKY